MKNAHRPMKSRAVQRHSLILVTALIAALCLLALLQINRTTAAPLNGLALQQQDSLPVVEFLGEGPATFEIDSSLQFLIKIRSGNIYTGAQPPTYTAVDNERVWSIDFFADTGVPLYDDETSFGQVDAGCQVDYVQIEDDLDERINRFFINDEVVHEVEQGMVTYGSFVVSTAGELTYFAEDSVGMAILVCPVVDTPTPTATPTSTPTATPMATSTQTPVPTVILVPTEMPRPGPTGVGDPTDLEVIDEPGLEPAEHVHLPLIY